MKSLLAIVSVLATITVQLPPRLAAETAASPAVSISPPLKSPKSSVPLVIEWERQMLSHGEKHCRNLSNPNLTFDQKLAATYYDAQWVFYQIGDYTKDSSWYLCAQAAETVYRDQYALHNNGGVPGYWNFTHGLTKDCLQTGDAASKKAVVLLARNAAYAGDWTEIPWTSGALRSREAAYAIMSYLNAEKVGEPHRKRCELLVNQALGHLDQWFVSQTAPFIQPFMVALTCKALIMYNDVYPDPRILPAISYALDRMWNTLWLPAKGSFLYINKPVPDEGGPVPAPDLNLLICPAYAWLYNQTGEAKWRDRADAVFTGGVKSAHLTSPKQFNQNYCWSFDYIKWRTLPPIKKNVD